MSIYTERGRNERLISYSTVAELAKNIRRNIRHMHRGLEPGEDRDSWLIDYLNHMDTLAQQIEVELGCYQYLCARNADTKDSYGVKNMKAPMIYNLEDLNDTNEAKVEINGKWVPARPLGFFSIWWRLKAAWLAFTGQCDLVRWPEGQ